MINEQTKDILMLEKEPSSYVDDSLEPSERTPQDNKRRKLVKNISNLNESFENVETKKKPEKKPEVKAEWTRKIEKAPIIG